MTLPVLLLFTGVVLATLTVLLVWRAQRRRLLRGAAERKVREVWLLTERIADPSRKILEADKVLDAALSLLGYSGTLGEKLKKAGPRFRNLNAVWSAHKLRNAIAHDLDHRLTSEEASRAMRGFHSALRDLGMKDGS